MEEFDCVILVLPESLKLEYVSTVEIKQSQQTRTMTICGTPGFVAPEIMLGNDYDEACDVFSYGNVLAELVTFKRPGDSLKFFLII